MKIRYLQTILIIVCLMVWSTGFAANWYVAVGASGSNNGSDWNNAWNEMNQINWCSVQPGDTIWLAGGTYATTMKVGTAQGGASQCSPYWPGGTSANRVHVKRVLSTDAVPVAAVGWRAGFDSQVNITANGGIAWAAWGDQTASYVTIDGRVDTGSSCGISTTSLDGGVSVSIQRGVSGVTLQYIDMGGPGGTYAFKSSGSSLYAGAAYNRGTVLRDLLVQYCRIHGQVNLVLLANYPGQGSSIESPVFQYNKFYDNSRGEGSSAHPNVVQAGGATFTGTCIFRYNEVYDWDAEGIMFISTGTWQIYGNLFHDGGGYSRVLDNQAADTIVYFYNNTMVNIYAGIWDDVDYGETSQSRNNIWYNVQPGAINPSQIVDTDYNFFDIAIPAGDGGHSIGSGSNPFINSSSDYRLAAGSSPIRQGQPLASLSLPSLYSTDIIGVAYSTPPSMGAYEYAGAGYIYFRAPQAGDGSMQRATGGTGSITY